MINHLATEIFAPAKSLVELADRCVSATVIEEETMVFSVAKQRGIEKCERCLNPERAIVGVIVFWPLLLSDLKYLGKASWAVCSICLDSLKQRGERSPAD